jgi:hypothetical protein
MTFDSRVIAGARDKSRASGAAGSDNADKKNGNC